MKVLSVTLWLLLLSAASLSQVPAPLSDSQKVSVIQNKWRVEIRNPRLDEDPLKASKETELDIRARREDLRKEAILVEKGLPAPAPGSRRAGQPKADFPPPTASYIYEAKFRNNGEKAIQTLIWDYIFFDSSTNAEVGRLRFESKARIAPGKTKVVTARYASPPTGNISAENAGKKLRDQYTEKVIVRGIRYADGSIWKAPESPAN